jgi:hypothetical protein
VELVGERTGDLEPLGEALSLRSRDRSRRASRIEDRGEVLAALDEVRVAPDEVLEALVAQWFAR